MSPPPVTPVAGEAGNQQEKIWCGPAMQTAGMAVVPSEEQGSEMLHHRIIERFKLFEDD